MNLSNLEVEMKLREQEARMINDIKQGLYAFDKDQGALIPILRMIQDKYSYLSKDAITLVADHVGVSPSEVYGVATFYNQFRFNPPGKHLVKVCLGTACHVKGGEQILITARQRLGVDVGGTTADGEYDLDRVACLGCCALAPVVAFDSKIHSQMSVLKVQRILDERQAQKS